ncbi:hypothetical protein LFREDSHE_28880 [Shewanella baltica]
MAISIKNKLGLTSKILIGMGTGIALGLLLRNAFPESDIVKDYITEGFLHVIGTIFISSLKMLVVPLVFISLVCGTCSLSEPSKLGRLGAKPSPSIYSPLLLLSWLRLSVQSLFILGTLHWLQRKWSTSPKKRQVFQA